MVLLLEYYLYSPSHGKLFLPLAGFTKAKSLQGIMLKDLPLPLLMLDTLFQEVKNIEHMSFVLPEIHLRYQSYADIHVSIHVE